MEKFENEDCLEIRQKTIFLYENKKKTLQVDEEFRRGKDCQIERSSQKRKK